MEQVLKIIQENIALISLGVFSLIEFTPIKFSPLDFIGKRLNKTTNENLERTNENLKKTNEHLETYHQEEAKILITDFVQDIKNGEVKSETQWIAMMNFVNEYIEKGWNSEIKQDALYIEKKYKEIFMK